MFEEVNCHNCKYYNDIMLMNNCEKCALRFSKAGEKILFELKSNDRC